MVLSLLPMIGGPVATATIVTLGQAAQESTEGSLVPNSLWDLVQYAQGFEWPLGALFLIGLFLLTSAYVRYFRQWRGSKGMLQIDSTNISPKDFMHALKQTTPRNPFFLSGTRLVEEHRRGGSAQSMIDFASRYIDFDHDTYKETDRYITAAVYIALSLGLLGTLMGIFVLLSLIHISEPTRPY